MTAKVLPRNENLWMIQSNMAEISEVNEDNTKFLQALKNCVCCLD